MKFKCHSCKKETTFNLDDYIGTGKKQQRERLIEMVAQRFPKRKEIIVTCSNPDCKKPNKVIVTYYE